MMMRRAKSPYAKHKNTSNLYYAIVKEQSAAMLRGSLGIWLSGQLAAE
jgi:hypothetical protein